MATAALNLIHVKKSEEFSLAPEQKAFNRLKKKIETLQKVHENRMKELDACLAFYFNKIQPEERAFHLAFVERLKAAYQFYKGKNDFSQEELSSLKELLLDDINQIFETKLYSEVSEDIKKISEDLHGEDSDTVAAEELTHAKDVMQHAIFEEFGVNLDLSEIDIHDGEQEIMEKLFKSFNAAGMDKDQKTAEKPKSKKQLQKEEKQREIQEMQKRGISAIYKQLVKVFHPDLEQDSVQKGKKEELMKRLTTAYEKKDLHTLLLLEMEWVNNSGGEMRSHDNSQLRIYNSVLKDQVEVLKQNIDMLILSPQYVPIQKFYGDKFSGMFALHCALREVKESVQSLQKFIQRLKTKEASSILRQALQPAIAMTFRERFS